jgi:hypothetical protein
MAEERTTMEDVELLTEEGRDIVFLMREPEDKAGVEEWMERVLGELRKTVESLEILSEEVEKLQNILQRIHAHHRT